AGPGGGADPEDPARGGGLRRAAGPELRDARRDPDARAAWGGRGGDVHGDRGDRGAGGGHAVPGGLGHHQPRRRCDAAQARPPGGDGGCLSGRGRARRAHRGGGGGAVTVWSRGPWPAPSPGASSMARWTKSSASATAVSSGRPSASPAVTAADRVQPVPWV